MDQSSQDAWLCRTFEVSAGFAEPRSAQADGPDLELLAHEMIQRHASPLLRTPVKTLAIAFALQIETWACNPE